MGIKVQELIVQPHPNQVRDQGENGGRPNELADKRLSIDRTYAEQL